MNQPRVAFLGLGIMGSGMAHHILAAGFTLTVYNRSAERTKPLAAKGASVAASPKEAAARADVVISMVADDVASRSMWTGENGVLATNVSGKLLIECSTLTVGWIRELAALAQAGGGEFLDAPVTGSKPQAANAELLFLVGGSAQTLERARPVLSVMSRDIQHFGITGSGAVMKLINNFMCGVQAASLAEAAALITANGLDREKAFSMLNNGAPASPMVKSLSARAAAGDFTPNFELKLMAKDLNYSNQLAQQNGLGGLPSAAAAQEVFNRAIAAGYGEKDISAAIEFLSRQAAKKETAAD